MQLLYQAHTDTTMSIKLLHQTCHNIDKTTDVTVSTFHKIIIVNVFTVSNMKCYCTD